MKSEKRKINNAPAWPAKLNPGQGAALGALAAIKYMIRILLILIISLPFKLILGQESLKIDKYNLDSACYSMDGQQDVNYCLFEAKNKLSKIMQIKFDCLIAYFDFEIIKYSSSIEDTSIVADYIQEKQLLISSQNDWSKLTEDNARFWGIGGGSISPMYVAESLIKDIKDRLKWLDDIIEEEGQGNVIEVLRCE
jgi:uncharacterized protein YecT (DUF1311 family)